MELKDKAVVITGATKGLGKALAEALSVEGAKLVVSGIGPELNEVASSLHILGVKADVTDEAQIQALAQKAVEALGGIDIWINNAGVWLPHGTVEEVPTEKARKLMDVNFWGTFFGCREALKIMKNKGGGTILNIVSARAVDPRAGEAVYGATKFAANGLSEYLRLELAPYGIQVIAVHPGGMRTELFREKMPENYAEYMDPAEVARKIVGNLKQDKPLTEQVIRRA